MDAGIVVVFFVGFSILQTLWNSIFIHDPKYNSGAIIVAIFTACLMPLLFFYDWAVWLVLGVWLLFGLFPFGIRNFAGNLAGKKRYDEAIWLLKIARILHPFNQFPGHPKIAEAIKLEIDGELESAIAILLQFEKDPQWRVYAMAKVFGLRGQYQERLLWLRENLSDKDYQRDPTLLMAYIRALATVGDLNAMLREFMRLKGAAERVERRLLENFLLIFAYCGKEQEVNMLLDTTFAALPDESKQLWLALSEYAAGNIDKALDTFNQLANHGNMVTQQSAKGFLDTPPVIAKDVLNPESQSIVKDLQFELQKNALFLELG